MALVRRVTVLTKLIGAVALERFRFCNLRSLRGLTRALEAFQPFGSFSMEASSFFRCLIRGITLLVINT